MRPYGRKRSGEGRSSSCVCGKDNIASQVTNRGKCGKIFRYENFCSPRSPLGKSILNRISPTTNCALSVPSAWPTWGTPCSRCWCAPGSVPMARPREGGCTRPPCPGAGGEPGGEGGADPAPFDGGGGRCVPPRAERSREVGTRPCHPGPVRRGHGPGGPVGLAVSEGPAGPGSMRFSAR